MPRIAGPSRGDGVQAVVLALRIMEYLAGQREAVGVTALGSRIYRHLRTLVEQGYVVQSAGSEKYNVGTRLVTLGRAISENFDLASAARGPMRDLRDALGHSVVLCQLEGEGLRVLSTLPGKSTIEIGVKHGSVLGFHSSAQGKVALAFGEDATCARVLRSRLAPLTPHTINSPTALRAELARVRRQGWATSPSETVLGTNALGAPIFDASARLVGTVAIVDSVQFIEAAASPEQVGRVTAAAAAISRALGYDETVRQPAALAHAEIA